METAPFIIKEFKPFTFDTKVADAKLFFKETAFSHFPIVKKNVLIGLISKIDLAFFSSSCKQSTKSTKTKVWPCWVSPAINLGSKNLAMRRKFQSFALRTMASRLICLPK